jgi:hypothetical protein
MDGTSGLRIWKASREDFPWMKQVARACYSEEFYVEKYGDPWLLALLEHSRALVVRSDHAWMAIEGYLRAGSGAPMARFQMVASEGESGLELRALTRLCVEWAKRSGAKGIFWEAVTGIDLGPLARSVGAEPVSPSYHLRFA